MSLLQRSASPRLNAMNQERTPSLIGRAQQVSQARGDFQHVSWLLMSWLGQRLRTSYTDAPVDWILYIRHENHVLRHLENVVLMKGHYKQRSKWKRKAKKKKKTPGAVNLTGCIRHNPFKITAKTLAEKRSKLWEPTKTYTHAIFFEQQAKLLLLRN